MKTIQIVGPYWTNYSLAKVNRGLAFALTELQDEYDVKLWCSDKTIDHKPTESELNENKKLASLILPNKTETDIVIYNNYPKNPDDLHGLKDLPGKIIIPYVAWEETVYPKHWVDEINKYAHGVMTISSFVKTILRRNGVKVPIISVPIAIDERHRVPVVKPFPLKTLKSFKFLHVSTGRARKGVDVLLKAYFSEFTKDDDVTLVIKSFPNPDNLVDKYISELKNENSPEVIHINDPYLTEEEMRELTAAADCAVYPSRAEGFGLPAAEAMYQNVPVIVTGYSGFLDFVDETSGFMIDYSLEYAKGSEMINLGAKWAEPSVEDLQRNMKVVFEQSKNKDSHLQEIISRAKQNADELSWANTAQRAFPFIKSVEQLGLLKKKRVAIITPYNTNDGIAEHSKKLFGIVEHSFEKMFILASKDISDSVQRDDAITMRTWETGETSFSETLKFVTENNIDSVIIQYHSGTYFPPESLNHLITELKSNHVQVIVELHAVHGDGFDFIQAVSKLSEADTVIIHNEQDYNYAKKSLSNAVLFQLPVEEFPIRLQSRVRRKLGLEAQYIVGTHGLLNVNKNVPLILESFAQFHEEHPDSLFVALTAVSANNVHAGNELKKVKEVIKKYNLEDSVILVTDFLEKQLLEILLQSLDLIVLAYSDAGESASAAVRTCMATRVPVVTSNIPQFIDFKEEVIKLNAVDSTEIYKVMEKAIDSEMIQPTINAAKTYLFEHNFDSQVVKLLQVIK